MPFEFNLGFFKGSGLRRSDLLAAALFLLVVILGYKVYRNSGNVTALAAKVDTITQEKAAGRPVGELLRDGDSKDGVKRP